MDNIKKIIRTNAAFDILDNSNCSGSDWGQGGCAILASALNKLEGYPIYVIYNKKFGGVEHFGVKTTSGSIIDHDGEHSNEESWLNFFKENEMPRQGELVVIPYTKEIGMNGVKFDDNASNKLAILIKNYKDKSLNEHSVSVNFLSQLSKNVNNKLAKKFLDGWSEKGVSGKVVLSDREYFILQGIKRDGKVPKTKIREVVKEVLSEMFPKLKHKDDHKQYEFIDWLSMKLGKKIGNKLGSGLSGSVFDMGNSVIKIMTRNDLDHANILNKNIPGTARVYANGKINVPKKFLRNEFGTASKFVDVPRGQILVRDSGVLYYLIMEKVRVDNDIENDITDIMWALESYFDDYKKTSSEIPVLSNLFEKRNNEKFIKDFAKFLRDDYVQSKSDYNNYLETLAELIGVFRSVGKHFDWMDIHAGQFGRNSKGELVAFDLDNSHTATNDFVKHTVSENLVGSWSKGDKMITLRQLLNITKDVPVQKIKTSLLSKVVINFDKKEEKNINKSNLKYPVLLAVGDNNEIKYIIDGNHRVQKAIKNNLPTVKCKLIKISELPNDFKSVFKISEDVEITDDNDDGYWDRVKIIARNKKGKEVGFAILDMVITPDSEFAFMDDEHSYSDDEIEEHFPEDVAAKLEHLEVYRDYRGKGFGKELMDAVVKYVKKRDYKTLFLIASPVGLEPKISLDDLSKFYSGYGFKVIKDFGNAHDMVNQLREDVIEEEYDGEDLYGYHVTSAKNLDAINKKGLTIGSGQMQGKGVYAFYNMKDALTYGGKGGVPTVGDGVAIVKFKITDPERLLILNMEIAKKILGDKYQLKDQVERKYWGHESGINGLVDEARKAYKKNITKNDVIKILDYIEDNNSEMNQRTFWSNLISKDESDRLNLLHNGNYGIEFRINNPSLIYPIGYFNLTLDGLSDFKTFEKEGEVPESDEYDDLRKLLDDSGKDLAYVRKKASEMMYKVRNNREYDMYSKIVDQIDDLLSKRGLNEVRSIVKDVIKEFVSKTVPIPTVLKQNEEESEEELDENKSEPNSDFFYEFHLSTEPNLKNGVNFKNQVRTNSDAGIRGHELSDNISNDIYTTSSPEDWYGQFEMELNDVPEAIPRFLYIVKVKNESDVDFLNQTTNKPGDVVVVGKVPNKNNGEPDFRKGYSMLGKIENKIKSLNESVENTKCSKKDIPDYVVKYLSKFSSDEELLRSGGFPTDMLDRWAFGFTESEVKTLKPEQLKIRWHEDFDNVKWEIDNTMWEKPGEESTKENWATHIDLSEPIDVYFLESEADGLERGFYIEDGHHRYYAAKILGKSLNVNLQIKVNPIKELSDLGYDDFHRCVFNSDNTIEEVREIIRNILKEDFNSEVWYHGTPDVRELEKQSGFSERIMSVEYIDDIEDYVKFQEELRKSREADDGRYFKLLDIAGDFKSQFKMRKPIFLTNDMSVARTYADPQRAFDYQGAVEKILKVRVKDGRGVEIIATGDRFRFIDIDKVRKGFLSAGISSEDFEEVLNKFTFYLNNKKGIKTDMVAAIGEWFGFNYIDVVGVLDSYNGGSTKSTVRMVFNPSDIEIIK